MPGGCEHVVLRIRQTRERWLADHAGGRRAGWDAPELRAPAKLTGRGRPPRDPTDRSYPTDPSDPTRRPAGEAQLPAPDLRLHLAATPAAPIAGRSHDTRRNSYGISLGSNNFAPARRKSTDQVRELQLVASVSAFRHGGGLEFLVVGGWQQHVVGPTRFPSKGDDSEGIHETASGCCQARAGERRPTAGGNLAATTGHRHRRDSPVSADRRRSVRAVGHHRLADQ